MRRAASERAGIVASIYNVSAKYRRWRAENSRSGKRRESSKVMQTYSVAGGGNATAQLKTLN